MTYTVTTGEPKTMDMGHRVTAWQRRACVVYGGWAIVWSRWIEDADGWDIEQRPTDGRVYDTKDEAEAAMREAA